MLTYNPALPNIRSIRKKYLPILQTSDRCKKAIPTLPMAAFRRPQNLRHSLMHSFASRRDICSKQQTMQHPQVLDMHTHHIIDYIYLHNHPQNIQYSTCITSIATHTTSPISLHVTYAATNM